MARPSGTKKIESPEKLLEYFEQYKIDTKNNPYKVKDWVGGAGKEVTRLKERPLTMVGFEVWLGKKKIILGGIDHYVMNTGGLYDDYRETIIFIKNEIRQDQIEGANAGVFNANLTSRMNNLAETVNTNTNVSILQIDPLVDNKDATPANNSTKKDSGSKKKN